MSNTDNILEVKNIHKIYEGASLLKGINFRVDCGETFCLLGRSGSGKSTLLRIIAGLESADEGEVLWNGQSMNQVPAYQRSFGLMFQDYALFPHMNVSENVAFGLRMQNRSKSDIASSVREALELVNMSGFAERSVTDLSGGEQQRIALARALAPQPRLLMLDEPLAALDRALRMELQEELRTLLHKTGIPAIYVTHDQEEALLLGDRVAILADGVIEQAGKPEEVYLSPRNRKVAEFLGMTNFIEGKVVSIEPLLVETSLGVLTSGQCMDRTLQTGQKITLLVNTSKVTVVEDDKQDNVISGIVQECTFRGEDYKIMVRLDPSTSLLISLPNGYETGSVIQLHLSPEAVICLND